MAGVRGAHLLVVFVPPPHSRGAAEDGAFDGMTAGRAVFETAAGFCLGGRCACDEGA